MNTPTIYTATPADLSPPVQTESFCVDLVLATDYQKLKDEFKQLAAENVALKQSERELDKTRAEEFGQDWVSEFTETPATDRIVAGFKADGVEEFAAKLRIPGDDQFFDALAKGVALAADDFAKQLREGAK